MPENDMSEELFEQELTLVLLYLASWTEGNGLAPRACPPEDCGGTVIDWWDTEDDQAGPGYGAAGAG